MGLFLEIIYLFSTELIIGLAIVVIVFMLIRNVLCWYWKINTIVLNLEEIISKLSILSQTKEDFTQNDKEVAVN